MKRLFSVVTIVLLYASLVSAQAYNRDAFEHWSDINDDDLDARQEALYKQAVRVVPVVTIERQFDESFVITGYWVCPYTGKQFTDPTRLDVDHIVPLKWAWLHGAYAWDEEQRKQFANDQANLIAVDAGANRSKGAKGPTEWMPPNLYFGLQYLSLFIHVCEKYDLEYDRKAFAQIARQVKVHQKGIKLKKLE